MVETGTNKDNQNGNKIIFTKDRIIEEIGRKIMSMSPSSKDRLIGRIKEQRE